MEILELISQIPLFGPVLPYVPLVIALAAVVAPFVAPPTSSTGAYAMFYALLNWAAFNKGHATNATAPTASVVSATTKASLLALCIAAMGLSACTPAEQTQVAGAATTLATVAAAENTTVAKLVTKGALFCQKNLGTIETATGAAQVVAVATGQGVAASVLNQSATAVAATCAVLNAVPVPPPAAPETTPVVTVPTTTLPPVAA
jgi:hypothetical protein